MTKSQIKKYLHSHRLYGTTTIGEKGQLVIPSEARSEMKIAKGEKLLVFGIDGEMIMLFKLSNLAEFAAHLANKLKTIKQIINKQKK